MHLKWSEEEVREAFDQLAGLALLRQSVDKPNMWRPANPEFGLRLLLQRQQAELQDMLDSQDVIAKIVEEYAERSPAGYGSEGREIIGIDSVFARIDELALTAHLSLCSFVSNPIPSETALAASLRNDELTTSRGVTIRTVFSEALTRERITRQYMQALDDLGGQIRLVPSLPTRMLVYDNEVALVPLDPADSRLGAVELRGPGVVVALQALFELTWASATPFGAGRPRDEAGLSARERELLGLLAKGLTDEAVSKRLGISLRSVRRVVQGLMERFDARSRFELGMRAAGYLKRPPVNDPPPASPAAGPSRDAATAPGGVT